MIPSRMLASFASFAMAAAMILGLANAAEPEKKDVHLGVGGKGLLCYLPLTIAERK